MSSPNEINENVTGTQPVTDTSTHNFNDNPDHVLNEQKEPDAPAEQHEDSEAAVDDAETMNELLGESDNEQDVITNNADEKEHKENENVEEKEEENENEDSSVENENMADDVEQTKSPTKNKPAQKKKRKQTASLDKMQQPQINNFKQLVEQALCTLKDRKGSSAKAIANWGQAHMQLISIKIAADRLVKQVNKSLKNMIEEGSVVAAVDGGQKFKLTAEKKSSLQQKQKVAIQKFKKKGKAAKNKAAASPTKKSPTKQRATKLKKGIMKTPPKKSKAKSVQKKRTSVQQKRTDSFFDPKIVAAVAKMQKC